METREIEAVFDRTFNGIPNPIFCYPIKYFEHNGYLCEIATSTIGPQMAREVERELNKTPLAIFNMMFADCGSYLTVLTREGKTTSLGGHFDSEEELNNLLAEL